MQKREEHDAKVEELSKKLNFNDKMKKHTLCEEHVAHAVREFYSDLKEAKHHDLNLQSVIILGKRCYEQLISGERSDEIDLEPSRPKYQKPGGGTKITRYPQNPKSLVANKNLQNIILIIL